METHHSGVTKQRLDDISTELVIVRDPAQFVMRYAPAIQKYFAALIKNRHDAEEAAQDFFLRVTQFGLVRTWDGPGRFRDYLKAAVRNAALNYLRRNRAPRAVDSSALQTAIPDSAPVAAHQAWVTHWRQCLLDKACRALETHQGESPGNLFHTVLSMLVENPLERIETLAARTSALIGRPLQAVAFRKQVSRARRMLAKLLVKGVAQTLDNPTPEQIMEKLIDLALWGYIRDFLASDPRIPRKQAVSSE
jgi:RNA polymerase sigma factor (sigma-70 family)